MSSEHSDSPDLSRWAERDHVMLKTYEELLDWAESNPYPDMEVLFNSPLAEAVTRRDLEHLLVADHWDKFLVSLRQMIEITRSRK